MANLMREMDWCGAITNGWGFSSITADRHDHLYEPSTDLRTPLAWIVPAGRRDQDGVLVDVDDVVAFFRPRPRIWFLRLGAITLLGDEELDLSRWRREPFLLHETLLEYALAGGVGGCIVDWRRFDPRQYFDGHPAGVICATKALERRLHKRIADLLKPCFEIAAVGGEVCACLGSLWERDRSVDRSRVAGGRGGTPPP